MIGAITHAPNTAQPGLDPRLPRAAQEFEGMLLADLMKMANSDDSDPDSDASCRGYDDLRNQAVASALARHGGIGIARMLLHKLGADNGIKEFSSSADSPIAGVFRGDANR